MQLMLKAIRPIDYEVVWYLLFGFLALVLLNLSGIMDVLLQASQIESDAQGYIRDSLVGVLQDVSSPLNGRLGNSVVWAFLGVLAYTLGSILISEIQDLLDHSDEARKTTRRQRSKVWTEYILRIVIRTIALVLLLIWAYIVVAVVIPYASGMLLESLLAPTPYLWGLVALLLGSITLGTAMYVGAILCRFVALRVRVFSGYI